MRFFISFWPAKMGLLCSCLASKCNFCGFSGNLVKFEIRFHAQYSQAVEKHCENRKMCPENISLVVKEPNVLTKKTLINYFSHKLRFVIIQVLSQFEFLSFVTIKNLEYCHNLSFLVFSQF